VLGQGTHLSSSSDARDPFSESPGMNKNCLSALVLLLSHTFHADAAQRVDGNKLVDEESKVIGVFAPLDSEVVEATDSFEFLDPGILEWTRKFALKVGQPKQPVRLTMDFVANHRSRFSVVPGVSFDGNRNDPGNVYHGFEHDGVPWSWASHRTTIPGATYSEGERWNVGLYANAVDPDVGLACSLIPAPKQTTHRLIVPQEEQPQRILIRELPPQPGRTQQLVLEPGRAFEAKATLVVTPAGRPRLGYRRFLDSAWSRFAKRPAPRHSPDDVWDLAIGYPKNSLWQPDVKMFAVSLYRASAESSDWTPAPTFEIGWVGRNTQFATLLLRDYLARGDAQSLEIGLACLDSWSSRIKLQPGMKLDGFAPLGPTAVNLASAVTDFFAAGELAERCERPKPEYSRLATALADAILAIQTETGRFEGYGSSKGDIGAQFVPALIVAYESTKNMKYLNAASAAQNAYMNSLYQLGYFWGGTLDTHSIDSETAYPLLEGAVRLYEITKGREFLGQAEDVAYYDAAWTIHQSIRHPNGTVLDDLRYETRGSRVVATHHMCAHNFGLLTVRWLLRLAKHTGNPIWRDRAVATYAVATQGMSDGTTQWYGGPIRPRGAQDETFWCSDWGIDYDWAYGFDRAAPRGCTSQWLTMWTHVMLLETLADPMARQVIEEIPLAR
jgi:hypothetical protein